MPLREGKHDHVKVYRPVGSRFVEADLDRAYSKNLEEIANEMVIILEENFELEFGENPDGTIVFEFVVTDANVTGTMWELKG